MNTIEVNIKVSDLEYVRFEFWLDGITLYLDRLIILKRETTRHKLKVDFRNSYSRIDKREYSIKEEPDVPIEVQWEALRILKDKLTVKRWEDR